MLPDPRAGPAGHRDRHLAADRAHAGPGAGAAAAGDPGRLPQLDPGPGDAARRRAAVQGRRARPALPRAGAAARRRARSSCSPPPGSRCSRSTRRTACPSGATTSGPTTWSSRCCTSAGRTCRGSRSPRRRPRATREEIAIRLKLAGSKLFVSSFDRPNIQYRIVPKNEPKQAAAVAPAHRARRGSRDRVLPVAGLDGEDRGVPHRQRDPGAAVPRGPRRRRRGPSTRRASCARTAW